MNFREFTESVQLIRNMLQDHQVVRLGRMGWWDVYSARQRQYLPSPFQGIPPNPQILSPAQAKTANTDVFADSQAMRRFLLYSMRQHVGCWL